jgi:hypothetical protein
MRNKTLVIPDLGIVIYASGTCDRFGFPYSQQKGSLSCLANPFAYEFESRPYFQTINTPTERRVGCRIPFPQEVHPEGLIPFRVSLNHLYRNLQGGNTLSYGSQGFIHETLENRRLDKGIVAHHICPTPPLVRSG